MRVVPVLESKVQKKILRTNNLGLRRDTPTALQKPPGVLRILVLGDSQSEGIVENAETYAALVESALGRVRPTEVLNAATSGYSPLLSYLWWERYGASLQPDAVLLALYTGNDLGELLGQKQDFGGWGDGPAFSLPTLRETSDGGFGVEVPGASGGLGRMLDHWLSVHVRSWTLLHARFDRLFGPAPPAELAAAMRHCPGCMQAVWQPWFLRQKPDREPRAWQRLSWTLARFRDSVHGRGARFYVAVLPTKPQVESEAAWNQAELALHALGLSRQEVQDWLSQIHARFVAEGQAVADDSVDLLPTLQAARQTSAADLYWQLDWHLSASGHRAVGEALLPKVCAWFEVDPCPNL